MTVLSFIPIQINIYHWSEQRHFVWNLMLNTKISKIWYTHIDIYHNNLITYIFTLNRKLKYFVDYRILRSDPKQITLHFAVILFMFSGILYVALSALNSVSIFADNSLNGNSHNCSYFRISQSNFTVTYIFLLLSPWCNFGNFAEHLTLIFQYVPAHFENHSLSSIYGSYMCDCAIERFVKQESALFNFKIALQSSLFLL